MASSGGRKKGKKGKWKQVSLDQILPNTIVRSSTSWADEVESELSAKITAINLPTAPRAACDVIVDESRIPPDGPFQAYLSNLPFDILEEDIIQQFKDQIVVKVELPKDSRHDRMKGYGYVEFKDKANLIAALNEREVSIRGRSVRIALPNDDDRDKDKGPQRSSGNSIFGRNRDFDRIDGPDKTLGDWRAGVPVPQDDTKQGFTRNANRRDYGSGRDFGAARDFTPARDFTTARDFGSSFRDNNRFERDSDKDRQSNAFSRAFNRDGMEQRNRPFQRFDNREERSGAFDDRKSGNNFFGRRQGGFGGGNRDDLRKENIGSRENLEKLDEQPKTRPKLQINPRSTPIDTVASEQVSSSSSSIFGAAKPVDTTKVLIAIEEKLQRQETISVTLPRNSSSARGTPNMSRSSSVSSLRSFSSRKDMESTSDVYKNDFKEFVSTKEKYENNVQVQNQRPLDEEVYIPSKVEVTENIDHERLHSYECDNLITQPLLSQPTHYNEEHLQPSESFAFNQPINQQFNQTTDHLPQQFNQTTDHPPHDFRQSPPQQFIQSLPQQFRQSPPHDSKPIHEIPLPSSGSGKPIREPLPLRENTQLPPSGPEYDFKKPYQPRQERVFKSQTHELKPQAQEFKPQIIKEFKPPPPQEFLPPPPPPEKNIWQIRAQQQIISSNIEIVEDTTTTCSNHISSDLASQCTQDIFEPSLSQQVTDYELDNVNTGVLDETAEGNEDAKLEEVPKGNNYRTYGSNFGNRSNYRNDRNRNYNRYRDGDRDYHNNYNKDSRQNTNDRDYNRSSRGSRQNLNDSEDTTASNEEKPFHQNRYNDRGRGGQNRYDRGGQNRFDRRGPSKFEKNPHQNHYESNRGSQYNRDKIEGTDSHMSRNEDSNFRPMRNENYRGRPRNYSNNQDSGSFRNRNGTERRYGGDRVYQNMREKYISQNMKNDSVSVNNKTDSDTWPECNDEPKENDEFHNADRTEIEPEYEEPNDNQQSDTDNRSDQIDSVSSKSKKRDKKKKKNSQDNQDTSLDSSSLYQKDEDDDNFIMSGRKKNKKPVEENLVNKDDSTNEKTAVKGAANNKSNEKKKARDWKPDTQPAPKVKDDKQRPVRNRYMGLDHQVLN